MIDFNFIFDNSQCHSCRGKCCVGESGYIFVKINEMERIANFLKLEFNDFTQKYIRKVGYKFSFLEKQISSNEYACVFFDLSEKKCSIYDYRPKQCRDFPFWENYKTQKVTQEDLKQLGNLCKGVKCLEIS